MAPSSPTIAAARKPSPLSVITDGIHKKRHSCAELGADLGGARMSAQTATHDDACAAEMDADSVESPEDICGLSGDKWDVDEACCSGDAEETLPDNQGIKLYEKNLEAPPSGEIALNEAGDYECIDDGDELLLLLGV